MMLAVCVFNLHSQSKTYFVSPDGNDSASGLSIKDSWKTIERVNQAVFLPGDKLLFKAGGIWNGQLRPQGSGLPGKPITMSGYGGKERPVINLGKAEGAAIRFENQSWWEIDNIEITSGAPPEFGIGRQGIVFVVRGENQHVEHIVVRNCYIHDIWGQLGGDKPEIGRSCAILVSAPRQRGMVTTTSTLNDVLIEQNRIERVDKVGISVSGCWNDMIVRHNYIEGLGGDGIICSGCYRGLIEYNIARRTCLRTGYLDLVGGESWWPHTAAIWIANAEETVMQFNEVYDTGLQPRNADGFAYDFDYDCINCILQYNYSKNNGGGFMLVMSRTFGNIIRYNISENDGLPSNSIQNHLLHLNCDIADRNIFHNNVFYIDYGTLDLEFYGRPDKDKFKIGASFINNIFYATGQSHFRTVYTDGDVGLQTRTFDENTKVPTGTPEGLFYNNCYFGPWKNGIPDDPKKLVADPMFVSPGSGGNGLSTLWGYILREDSPCINTGMFIPVQGGRDFFGNPVEDGKPDFGAYEQIGSGVFADEALTQELTRVETIKKRLALARRNFPATLRLPDSDGKIVITLRVPLENSITGSITLSNSKLSARPGSFVINRPQSQRNDFTFSIKADKETLLQTSIHVILQDGEFKEEWDIPFAESTGSAGTAG